MLNTASAFPLRVVEEKTLDRRRVLKMAGAAALAACGGEWLAHREGTPAAAAAPLHVPDADSLDPGGARVVVDGAREVLVARLDDGALLAFDRRCPHLGCPVVYAATRARFECPCHHAAFDARTGRVLFGPPRRGLTRVEVVA